LKIKEWHNFISEKNCLKIIFMFSLSCWFPKIIKTLDKSYFSIIQKLKKSQKLNNKWIFMLLISSKFLVLPFILANVIFSTEKQFIIFNNPPLLPSFQYINARQLKPSFYFLRRDLEEPFLIIILHISPLLIKNPIKKFPFKLSSRIW